MFHNVLLCFMLSNLVAFCQYLCGDVYRYSKVSLGQEVGREPRPWPPLPILAFSAGQKSLGAVYDF